MGAWLGRRVGELVPLLWEGRPLLMLPWRGKAGRVRAMGDAATAWTERCRGVGGRLEMVPAQVGSVQGTCAEGLTPCSVYGFIDPI